MWADHKQNISTFPLRTCHCAEYGTKQSFNDNHLHVNLFLPAPIVGDPSEKQSQTIKHYQKTYTGLYPRHLRELSSPSERSFALSLTFERGRLSCLPFYPGWRGPDGICSLTRLCFGIAYPGLFMVFPLSGDWPWKDFETVPYGNKLRIFQYTFARINTPKELNYCRITK